MLHVPGASDMLCGKHSMWLHSMWSVTRGCPSRQDFKFPHNLWDALVGSDEFIWRVCWDLAFQVIFIYILLAIITGIVIDAFGALKEKKEAAEENLQSICFVCNIDRFTADQSGIGFDKHVRIEHNPK